MTGVLNDGHGIPCPECLGTCSVEGKNCRDCDGNGSIQPGEEEIREAESNQGAVDTAMFVYASSERPMFPTEWLSQPAIYITAYGFLTRYLFGEFEERKKSLADVKG